MKIYCIVCGSERNYIKSEIYFNSEILVQNAGYYSTKKKALHYFNYLKKAYPKAKYFLVQMEQSIILET